MWRWWSWLCVLCAVCAATEASSWASIASDGEPAFDEQRKPPIPVSFLSRETGWASFLYPPSARDRVATLIAHAGDARAELAETLGQPPVTGLEVRVARGIEEMATLAPQDESVAGASTGAAYPSAKLIVLSLALPGGAGPADLDASFRRQLAVLALRSATGNDHLPSWFVEGFAGNFSEQRVWARRTSLLLAALRGRLVPLLAPADAPSSQDLASDAETDLVAAEAADWFAYLLAPERRTRFPVCIQALRSGDGLASALHQAYGTPPTLLELAWRRELSRRCALQAITVAVGVPLLAIAVILAVRWARHRRSRAMPPVLARPRRKRVAVSEPKRVHIVLSRRGEARERSSDMPSDIPKVEHDGEWHTLH